MRQYLDGGKDHQGDSPVQKKVFNNLLYKMYLKNVLIGYHKNCDYFFVTEHTFQVKIVYWD